MCFCGVSVNFLIAVLTVSACIFESYLVTSLMYLPRFDPWEMYLLYLYYFKDIKNGSYKPRSTFYHIILTLDGFL